MSRKNYDKRIFRVLSLLNMLNARKKVIPTNLAEEFGVSARSVQRDIKLIDEVGFPIYKDSEKGSYYFVEGFNLGQSRLTEKEWALLLTFKEMAGKIGAPFDGLMNSIVQKNLHPTAVCDRFYFKVDETAAVPDVEILLSALVDAIRERETVKFVYSVYSDYEIQVRPYKIAQFGGFWYLIGEDTADKVLKKYALDRIKKVRGTGKYFSKIPDDLGKVLDESFNIWFGKKRGKRVLVEVSGEVSGYFRRKKWFPNQEVIEEKDNGNLVVSYVVSDYMEIIPFLKSWIPRVWVVKPQKLKEMLRNELKEGIKKFK